MVGNFSLYVVTRMRQVSRTACVPQKSQQLCASSLSIAFLRSSISFSNNSTASSFADELSYLQLPVRMNISRCCLSVICFSNFCFAARNEEGSAICVLQPDVNKIRSLLAPISLQPFRDRRHYRMLRLEWGHVQKVWSHGYGGNAADSNLHGKMGKKCGNSISQPLPKPNF